MERQQRSQRLPERPRGRGAEDSGVYEGYDSNNQHYLPNHPQAMHRSQQQIAMTNKDPRSSHTQGSSSHHRPRSPAAGSRSISLEDAIASLYECAHDAKRHFEDFHQDFKRDIRGIQEYCSQRIIDAVWTQKVRGGGGGGHRDHHDVQAEGRGSGRQHDGRPPADQQHQQDPSLRSTMKALLSATGSAVGAAEDFRPSQRRPSRYTLDDVSKIRQQLHRSHQNLRKSFGVLMGSRSEMEHVTTELEMLLLFLSRNGAGDGNGGNYEVGGSARRQRMGAAVEDDGTYGEVEEQVEEWTGRPE
ncbi:MAG: hypothetical protein Q9220_006692 [cf. Caloplaca sp. 1 TL-2023]